MPTHMRRTLLIIFNFCFTKGNTVMATKKKAAPAPAAAVTPEEKKKALDTAISQMEKRFGKGTIIKMGENPNMNVSAVSTGSVGLDMALGVGGVPRGRIIEIYGPESSGKTTVALHCVAEVQKLGGEAAYIDAEHALDPVYAKNLGVNIDELLVSQPDSGEQALEVCVPIPGIPSAPSTNGPIRTPEIRYAVTAGSFTILASLDKRRPASKAMERLKKYLLFES